MTPNKSTQNKIVRYTIIAAAVVVSAFFGFKHFNVKPLQDVIAITQIAQHNSLDKIRQGILDELIDQGLTCPVVYENAQGNITTAAQIAQKFVGMSPKLVVAITTPSAQSIYAQAKKFNIPVIFGAVSDPVSAKLVPSMKAAGAGITGVSDLPPVQAQITLIRQLVKAKNLRVGFLYNPAETNSLAMLEQFKKLAKRYNIKVVEAAAPNTVDVTSAATSLVGKVDAIYFPNDNTIASSVDSVVQIASDNKLPLFCADPESVKKGCLGCVSHDQYQLGRQTGKMVARFIKGESIENLPVETPNETEFHLNLDTANKIGLNINQATVDSADHVIHH